MAEIPASIRDAARAELRRKYPTKRPRVEQIYAVARRMYRDQEKAALERAEEILRTGTLEEREAAEDLLLDQYTAQPDELPKGFRSW